MPRNSSGKKKKPASKKPKAIKSAADVSFENFARQCDEAAAKQPTSSSSKHHPSHEHDLPYVDSPFPIATSRCKK